MICLIPFDNDQMVEIDRGYAMPILHYSKEIDMNIRVLLGGKLIQLVWFKKSMTT